MIDYQNLQNIRPTTAIGRTFYLLLPINLGDLELENIIFNLEENLSLGQKIRILVDDSKQFEKVQNLLCELQEKMQIKIETEENLEQKNLERKTQTSFEFNIYQTNFFQLETERIATKIDQNPTINWQNYNQNGFEYCEVFCGKNGEQNDKFDKQSEINNQNKENFEIAMNFFLTSFGSDFTRNLDGKLALIPDQKAQNEIQKLVIKALENPANKIFLVKKLLKNQTENQQNNTLELEKFPNKFEPKFEQSKKFEVVGVFSFLKIGNEVQLHYTAGKTTLTNNFVGKKLPILTAAMLDILKNSPNYQKTKKLTFSNKDESVSKAYESVGFELLQNRKCLLIK